MLMYMQYACCTIHFFYFFFFGRHLTDTTHCFFLLYGKITSNTHSLCSGKQFGSFDWFGRCQVAALVPTRAARSRASHVRAFTYFNVDNAILLLCDNKP